MNRMELEQLARKLIHENPASAGEIMLRLLRGNDIASAYHAVSRGALTSKRAFRKRVNGKRQSIAIASLPDKLAQQLPAREDNRRIMPDDFDTMVEKLPVREQLVISLAYAGLNGKQIAEKTGLSPMTVSRSFGIIRERFSELLVH